MAPHGIEWSFINRRCMITVFSFWFVYALICGTTVVGGTGCKQQGDCACVFENGNKIDLSKLGKRTGTPLIEDVRAGENFLYSYNPCYPFNEGDCHNVAACQKDDFDNFIAIGDVKSANLTYFADSGILAGIYSSTDKFGKTRTSKVSFICDPSADTPELEVLGEGPKLTDLQLPLNTPAYQNNLNRRKDYGDFIKRCEVEYDDNPQPVRVLFIRNWNGSCKFPTDKNVAISIYSKKSTCAGVTNRCKPVQAFSVNGEVCKELD